MASVKEVHDRAMAKAHAAAEARDSSDFDRAATLSFEAYVLERDAARAVASGKEPTRSVLFRSAAWMAIHANLPNEALRMVQEARDGDPPGRVEAELREVEDAARERLSLLTKKAS